MTVLLEKFLDLVKSQNDFIDIFKYLQTPNNSAILELRNALQITLSEKDGNMSKTLTSLSGDHIRIINLPKMTIANYCAFSETPENDCSKVLMN